ncbi:NAD(P)-dependent glycerol-3-phosphate dehydrogenase [Stappia taiwanensis]|uniref:Glycerol-3-phosphate dehydrogenase [NAD(P)+] n=1 Tax=Stappia taiwanensis TaxID=992267 RepID=A0A838XWL7_9HYPH|nr:NAD(P)H-dependent glycerol-3-phosphate dehydrogenase [Stappia taiwanensis]MBA4612886.1 NAD(P)-dependent glycerol-3-phosphate dehydrogenase [Stappia taiwanensis]GGF07059.1 glycerol-3-phosphate dehydrogenase [NAD(P)+] [Stappia taiwanensis]
MSEIRRIAVLGGGAWGTALALVAARAGRDTVLWARDPATVAALNARGENPAYLPGLTLTPRLPATSDLAEAVTGADAVLLVTPAQTTRTMAAALSPLLAPGTPVVLCAKGIERDSGLLLTDVLGETLKAARPAILSGPSFATDVAAGLPTAVTVAATDGALADALSQALASPQFRPYAATDIAGVQIGGALKNVLAIACGAVAGKKWGASALAALTARGFAELTRLGLALGARRETLTGLSGLGDLVLTCASPQSRNFAFGIALGEGATVASLTEKGQKLAEGVFSAPVAVALGRKTGVDLPICEAVAAVLAGELDLDDALTRLMTRPLRRET